MPVKIRQLMSLVKKKIVNLGILFREFVICAPTYKCLWETRGNLKGDKEQINETSKVKFDDY